MGQIRRFLEPCDLEIWRMTLKNNWAPLLSNIKLYTSFHRNMWIQTGVTVRKRLKWGHDLCDLDLWPLTLTFCMDIASVHGNNSWRFHDDTMAGTLWKRCDGRTDGQTERSVLEAAWSQLKKWSCTLCYTCVRKLCSTQFLQNENFIPRQFPIW